MNRLKNSPIFQFLLRLDAMLVGWWSRSLPGRWLTCQDPARSVFTPARQLAPMARGLLKCVLGWVPAPGFPIAALFAGAALILAPILPTMAVLALVCLCMGFALLHLASDRDAAITPSPLNVHIALYALVILWSTVTSVSFAGSLLPGMLTAAFVLFFYGVTSSGLEKHLDKVLWLLLAAGVGVSLYGFYQACFPERYSDVWTDTDLFSAITFRVYSTLANPNVLGEYLLLVIPIACAMLFSSDTWGKRIACLIAAGIMGVCLILTYSRGCYLGLLFAAAVFLVLLDRRFLFLGIIAVALCPLYLPDSVISRFTSIGNMTDTSTSYRVGIWLGSLAMLKDFGFSGVGYGSEAFNTIYPAYAMHSISAQHAHNLFLQILCDSGIVGLLVFLGLMVSFCRMMLTAIRHTSNARARILQIGGISAVSGFLVQSLTDYTFYNYRVMLLFFGMLGLCVLFTRMGRREAQA
ncbi:MAG: O-antigen ligase family protein [Oscillospiraceae bacterium]|nr:O-antigen ligase family protein [Oscillospiraceae bacterium]